MLFIFSLVELISIFVRNKELDLVRKKLFTFSVILSLFFFSSNDPILGLPLYIYPLIFSVAISFLYRPRISKQLILGFVLLLLSLIIPLVRMELRMETSSYFLIRESTTDVLNVNTQMHIPDVDIRVIKHFLFLAVYVLFIIVNEDLTKDSGFIKILLDEIIVLFKVLFIGIIIEWIIVNAMGGFNDRLLMGSIFSMKRTNQTTNWKTWGSYSVALWFPERSNFNIVAIYYMIYLKKREIKSAEWLWLVLSVFAIYCTGSSSCLAILAAYLLAEAFVVLVRNRKINQITVVLLILIGCTAVLLNNMELFTNKLQIFLSGEESWSSGYFRANSISYGIKAIKDHLLFGVGIGTVLAHSMLVQTIANIGIVGTLLMLWLHWKICPIAKSFINTIIAAFIIGISYGCYMIQNFTSPFLITIFIILNCSEEIIDAVQNSENNSLLLVWRKPSA